MAFMRCSPLENQRNHLPDGLPPRLRRRANANAAATSSKAHPLPPRPANAHPPLLAGSSPDGVALGGEGADVELGSGPAPLPVPAPTIDVEGALVSASAVPPNAPRLMRPPFGEGSSATLSAGSPLSVEGPGAVRRRSGAARSANETSVDRSPVPA